MGREGSAGTRHLLLLCLQQKREPWAASRKVFRPKVAECFETHGMSTGSCSFVFFPAGLKGHQGYRQLFSCFAVCLCRTLATVPVNLLPVRRQTGLPGVCVRLSHGNRGRENVIVK